jgi:hypothetical protein
MTEITIRTRVRCYKPAVTLVRAALSARWLLGNGLAVRLANAALRAIKAEYRIGGKWQRVPLDFKIETK